MKLYHYTLATNFGDELNPWLWGRLLPSYFNDNDNSIFVGIGTIINHKIPIAKKTAVFGSGVGYGHLPNIDESWKIYCVRGPLTANKLGLPLDMAITDPGLLVNKFVKKNKHPKYKFSFMPHGQNASDAWRKICETIGFGYIDAYNPVDQVLSEIGDTEILITEAMHGAIVADALRVPWIPVFTTKNMFDFKWQDWCSSVELVFKKENVSPIWDEKYATNIIKKSRHKIKTELAKRQLTSISKKVQPFLSEDAIITNLTFKLDEKLEEFKHDIKQGYFD